MTTELLPCPFCGEVPDATDPNTYWMAESGKWGAVQCCGVGPEIRTGYRAQDEWRDEAIAAWNKRAPLPAQWEPLPDGEYGDLDTVIVSGEAITICSAHGAGVRRRTALLNLPDDIRLCHRTSAQKGESNEQHP